MKFLFLGTGASSGIPLMGCECAICKSSHPKNKRLRSSGLLQKEGRNFLIDASPDIRAVALQYKIKGVQALFITHPHEDHVGGLNDLRAYSCIYGHDKIPMILSQMTLDVLEFRFGYLLDRFDLHVLKEKRGEKVIEGMKVRYFTYSQESMIVTGFRFGDFAYVTDIKEYEESIFEDLEGVKTLVLGAIHEGDARMHFSIEEAVQFQSNFKSLEYCYFTHLSHKVEHETVSRILPEGVHLAYDGLNIYV